MKAQGANTPILDMSNDTTNILGMALLCSNHTFVELRFYRMEFCKHTASSVIEQPTNDSGSFDKPRNC